MRRGGVGPRTAVLSAACTVMALALPVSAGAATQVGEVFAPESGCGANIGVFQTTSPNGQYTVPSAGVITNWTYQAVGASNTHLKFKVIRPAGGNSFTTVGSSPTETAQPTMPDIFGVTIPVQPGDIIGLYFVDPGMCQRTAPGYGLHVLAGDLQPGSTNTFNPVPDAQIEVAATLEPDCDNDGLGDEGQDPNILSCDSSAPETQITGGPKHKTKKKLAHFDFTSNEPGATFECSLNGAGFTPCEPPHTVKAKKGKNSFAVRAKDASGNVDGSPATANWKVKKKKKK